MATLTEDLERSFALYDALRKLIDSAGTASTSEINHRTYAYFTLLIAMTAVRKAYAENEIDDVTTSRISRLMSDAAFALRASNGEPPEAA